MDQEHSVPREGSCDRQGPSKGQASRWSVPSRLDLAPQLINSRDVGIEGPETYATRRERQRSGGYQTSSYRTLACPTERGPVGGREAGQEVGEGAEQSTQCGNREGRRSAAAQDGQRVGMVIASDCFIALCIFGTTARFDSDVLPLFTCLTMGLVLATADVDELGFERSTSHEETVNVGGGG